MHNPALVKSLIEEINKCTQPLAFMEVCGTHTMAISRFGLRELLPANVRLLSGPGCPVCVTATGDIDIAIAFARKPEVILTTFGDMIRVPGSRSNLAAERADGHDVRVVYSILDALEVAKKNPDQEVVFYGVGFETTAPITAFGIMEAKKAGLKNFSVICMHKTLPKALRVLLDSGEVGIDGFILPGHACTITGIKPFDFLATDYYIGGVVTGFEPEDILTTVLTLIRQKESGPKIENGYRRVVRDEGNLAALAAMSEVFTDCNSEWRGIGLIPGTGLMLNERWQEFDAMRRIAIDLEEPIEQKDCACGEILRGVKLPMDCPMFGTVCTPENPVGPCMVSSEGSCAAYYRYR